MIAELFFSAIVAIIWKPGLIYRNNHPPFLLNCYLYALQTYRTHSFKLRLLLDWYKHSRRWENSRQLCKPSTSSRVCIFTVPNSPNPSRVYIRVCKHGKRFLLLNHSLNHRWRVKVLREVLLVDHWTVWRKPQKVSPSFVPLSSFKGKFVMVQQAFQRKKSMRTSCILTNDIVTNLNT